MHRSVAIEHKGATYHVVTLMGATYLNVALSANAAIGYVAPMKGLKPLII